MDLYHDWFTHPEFWFQQNNNTDVYLIEKYKHLLETTWDSSQNNIEYHILHIIINDQLVRHIFRNQNANHIILYYLQKAIDIHFYINTHYNVYKQLDGIQWLFWGLPIRHNCNNHLIINLIHKTWKKLAITQNQSCITYLKKFLTASFNRMPMSQVGLLEYFSNNEKGSIDNLSEYIPILEYFPITVQPYISILETLFKNYIKKHNIQSCIISLSGGVDSMICSYILKQLQVKVYAIFIDYCNRTTDEAKFIQEWCSYIQIPLYMRSIHEIQRQPCMQHNMRNIYESYTRNVRYQCYKDAWKLIGNNCNPYIIMGHNENDCFENIITNICHQNKYNNLKGMKPFICMDDIYFCRPMLKIPKNIIYQEAQLLGIPYLKDSTPSWSQRGQIRDTIRPSLEKWDKRMVSSMFQLSKILKASENFKQIVLNIWIENTNHSNDIQLTVLNNDINITNIYLWQAYLNHYHIIIKQKSIENFISCLRRSIKKNINLKCILNHQWHITYTITSNTFTIYPSF